MSIVQGIVIVFGLALFEVISSIDNAVVNADVLRTMTARGRKWFLTYGIIFAVFLVRGLLPLVIVYLSNPSIGIINAFTATLGGQESVRAAIETSKPILLAGGGIYLVFLFLHWLFLEPKEYAFFLEQHIHRKLYFWFYALASVILVSIVWFTIGVNPFIALGAVIGSSAFFITNGFKHQAETAERELMRNDYSDLAKIMYLELIDLTFSIDGVLGAFAFTISVPLILLGNGIGAFVVRYVTVHGVATVKKYRFLKNGAMYSILALGVIMVLESLAVHVYTLLPPIITVVVVGIFLWLSNRELKAEEKT